MDETELQSPYEVCTETRALFPGFCALDFCNILQVIICYALGWNSDTKSGENGAFGKIPAFFGAVEEQGRKTRHVHFIVWLPHWNDLLCQLFSENESVRHQAAEKLAK